MQKKFLLTSERLLAFAVVVAWLIGVANVGCLAGKFEDAFLTEVLGRQPYALRDPGDPESHYRPTGPLASLSCDPVMLDRGYSYQGWANTWKPTSDGHGGLGAGAWESRETTRHVGATSQCRYCRSREVRTLQAAPTHQDPEIRLTLPVGGLGLPCRYPSIADPLLRVVWDSTPLVHASSGPPHWKASLEALWATARRLDLEAGEGRTTPNQRFRVVLLDREYEAENWIDGLCHALCSVS